MLLPVTHKSTTIDRLLLRTFSTSLPHEKCELMSAWIHHKITSPAPAADVVSLWARRRKPIHTSVLTPADHCLSLVCGVGVWSLQLSNLQRQEMRRVLVLVIVLLVAASAVDSVSVSKRLRTSTIPRVTLRARVPCDVCCRTVCCDVKRSLTVVLCCVIRTTTR